MDSSPELAAIHAHFTQDRRKPFRPIRVRFRTDRGVRFYELTGIGQGVLVPESGKFILVPPGAPLADFRMNDFIEVGFSDELDARERRREAS